MFLLVKGPFRHLKKELVSHSQEEGNGSPVLSLHSKRLIEEKREGEKRHDLFLRGQKEKKRKKRGSDSDFQFLY